MGAPVPVVGGRGLPAVEQLGNLSLDVLAPDRGGSGRHPVRAQEARQLADRRGMVLIVEGLMRCARRCRRQDATSSSSSSEGGGDVS